MDIIIMVFTIGSVLSMQMCRHAKQAEIKNGALPVWQISGLYASSLLMGSLGVLISVFMFEFQRSNKKFIFTNLLILAIQIVLIIYFV